MDIFRLLRRNDYYEISGNKMTSYSSTLGGGSINYWNGKRAGFCSTNHPLCSLTALGQVLSADSKLNLLQTMYHIWQVDGVVAKYQSHNRTYIEERKTIFDDTFVSMFELHSEQDVALILQFSGAINENSNLEIDNNYLIIEERHKDKEARSADSVIYKVIGITGDGEWLFEPSTKCYQWQKELNLISSHRSSEDCVERFSLIVAGGDTRDEALQRYRKAIDNPAKLFIDRRQYYEDYFKNNVPVFDCDNHAVKKMYYFIYYMVNANIYDFKSGLLNGEFESTGKFGLNAQWFWDSAFGAISEKWLNDVPFPRSSMSNTINAQRADGLLPFVLCEDEFLYVSWEIVQPFVLPIAIWDYYLKTGDLDFLREALPKLVKFDQWLVANRSPKDDGLINLQVPGESGWDNSKRYIFSHHMVQSDSPLIRENRFIQSPDFNSYFYLGRVIIAKIACLFGDNPLSEKFQAKSLKTLNAIKSMWNSETGLWHDRFEDNYEFTKVKTPGGMIPAITGAM